MSAQHPRLEQLTAGQLQQLPGHVRHWLEVMLSTRPADRAAFEAAACRLYELTGSPWHGNAVWCSSPLVLLIAASAAARIRTRGLRESAVERCCAEVGARFGAALALECRAVIGAALGGAARPLPPEPLRAAVGLKIGSHFIGTAVSAHGLLEGAALQAVAAALRPLALTESRLQRLLWTAAVEDWQSLVKRVRELFGGSPWHWQIMGSVVFGLSVPGRRLEAGGVHAAALTSLLWPADELCRQQEQAVRSAGWWYAHPEFLIVCERPVQIHTQAAAPAGGLPVHALHGDDGPAIAWRDGWGLHVFNGVRVPAWVVEHPEGISVARIEQTANAEQRRVMIERYGWGRFIAQSGATVVDAIDGDHPIRGLRGARLLRKDLPGEPEPIVFLEMRDSSPDPEGSFARYLERIDPNAYGGDAGRFCHAAMASRWRHREADGTLRLTFERWQDYQPLQES